VWIRPTPYQFQCAFTLRYSGSPFEEVFLEGCTGEKYRDRSKTLKRIIGRTKHGKYQEYIVGVRVQENRAPGGIGMDHLNGNQPRNQQGSGEVPFMQD
jgi:hypothetical protein